MNTDSNSSAEKNDTSKNNGEELKEALLKPDYTPSPEKDKPVGPFEHSGEVAGWTETEEKQEKSREDERLKSGGQADNEE
jgi:hypothetical protein